MTLRRDPDLDYHAVRANILGRFTTGAHVAAPDAERWVAAWEEQADALGIRRESRGFWSDGLRWIAQQRDQLEFETGRLRDAS
jgi:hypothetical protein